MEDSLVMLIEMVVLATAALIFCSMMLTAWLDARSAPRSDPPPRQPGRPQRLG